VSVTITSREVERDLCVVTARATTPDGRTDESVGAVDIAGLKGEKLANAYMKAETKAKRRVTLSICGLGWLDETEVESVQAASNEPRQIEAPKPEPEQIPGRISRVQGAALADALKRQGADPDMLFEEYVITRLGELHDSHFKDALARINRGDFTPTPARQPEAAGVK
jgi:hypothetical protein